VKETLRETILRAIQLGEVPKPNELVSLLEDQLGKIQHLHTELEAARAEIQRLTKKPKTRTRRRSKKTPALAPKLIFPTYEIPRDAPNVVRVAFGARDPVRAYELFLQADKLDGAQHTLIEAERLYLEAIRLDPSIAQAHTNLGNILYRRGDLDAAVRRYQDALRIEPNQPEAVYNLGIIKHDSGEPDRAIALFELALKLCPSGDQMEPDIQYRLAISRDEIGDVEAARLHWERILELDPNSEWADYARKWIEKAPPKIPNTQKPKADLRMVRGGKEEKR
jgi:tetratricopeptide (TPR) repeat protein